MIWDPEWDADKAPATAGHGEKWERLNNWLMVAWEGFAKRMAATDLERQELWNKPPMSASERALHVERFRAHLAQKYGTSAVDPRWESEKANRLAAREAPTRARQEAR